jgi:formiminotetrahydrofolate cyclodeaminase
VTGLAGPLAAGLTADAATLLVELARAADEGAAAAQAESLRLRAEPLAVADADAYAAAVAHLARRDGTDHELGRALEAATEVLVRICDTAADVAELAEHVADRCRPESRADALGAAVLAAAAAQTAAHLVEVNLAMTSSHPRFLQAKRAAAAAAAAVARCRASEDVPT